MSKTRTSCLRLLFAALLLAPLAAEAGETFDRVKRERSYRCGVLSQGGTYMGDLDTNGVWRGFFPDFCRVVAAALTGSAERVEFVQVSGRMRFEALRTRDVDVVMQNATNTLTRETTEKVVFPALYLYDGQGFLAHAGAKARNLKELQTAGPQRVCALTGTTTIAKLREMIAGTHPNLSIVQLDTRDGYVAAFASRQCDLLTHDRTQLAVISLLGEVGDVVIFPEVVSKEPFGPMVRDDDREWERLVRWSIHAVVQAEELGITAANAEARRRDDKAPEVQRLLGGAPGLGAALGVGEDWAYRAIAQVGNYGEIFERNLAPLKLSRGISELWTKGGLLYAPPLR